jgi:3-oxoacyl-[acyl-carrier protein] reductase
LNLSGRVAIVTGASRRQGIGAAFCRMFARHGADVFFTPWQPYDRNQPFGDDPDGPDACLKDLEAASVRAASHGWTRPAHDMMQASHRPVRVDRLS